MADVSKVFQQLYQYSSLYCLIIHFGSPVYSTQIFWFAKLSSTTSLSYKIKWRNRISGNVFWRCSGLSLSRLLSVSNLSLFRTKTSVPWTFVYSLSYFYLFISNFSISNKNLGLLRLFLSLSRTFSRLRIHLQSK